jgi:iron complex outermembrane receptor protein
MRGLGWAVLAATCSPIATGAALAQETTAQEPAKDSGDSLGVGEIVVTAQKRAQNIQDVPTAVTAFSGEQLAKLGFANSNDLAAQVPGLTAANVSGSSAIILFTIRGVNQNDFADHHESPIAIYEDEVYVAALPAAGFPLYDLERVETLKGPQGILFGRNASGGLIHFITAKPSNDFEALLRGGYGSGKRTELEAMLNVPFGESAALRLAGIRSTQDGYLENRIGEDRHETDLIAFRGQLRVDLAPNADIVLKGQYLRNFNERTGAFTHRATKPTGPGGTGERVGPNDLFWGVAPGGDLFGYRNPSSDPLEGAFDLDGRYDRKIAGVGATASLDLGNLSLKSITDFRSVRKDYYEDTDSSPNPLGNYATTAKVDVFFQELRANWDSDQVKLLAGANHLSIKGDYGSKIWDGSTFSGFGPQDGASYDTFGLWRQDKSAWSLFGQAEVALGGGFSLTGGARYTNDKVEFDVRNTVVIDTLGFTNIPGAVASFSDRRSEGLFDYKIQAQFEPTDDFLFYAGVSQGSKGAGYTGKFQPALPADIPYDSERLRSWEAGFKSALFDRRVFLNAAAYIYDYSDYQAFVFKGLLQSVVNLDARISGAEIEIQANPVRGLDVVLGGAVLFQAEADDVPLPDGSTAPTQRLPVAPDLTLNGLIRYTTKVPWGSVSAQLDGNYRSDVNFAIINHQSTEGKGYAVLNGRLSTTLQNERLELALFAKNIFDKRYQTFAVDVTSLSFTQEQWAPPRYLGGEIKLKF